MFSFQFALRDFINDARSVPRIDRLFLFLWIAGPFIYLIERSPADIWLSLMGLGFISYSARTRDWGWLGTNWVKSVIAFWMVMLVTSGISSDPGYALGEAVAWIRFPLYAAACAFWVGKSRARLTAMIFSMIAASAAMMGFLAFEFAAMLTNGNDAGGRLLGPYGDPIPGSFLGKAMMPLAVLLSALAMALPLKKGLGAGLFAGLIFIFTVITGERVNSALIGLAVLFGAFAWVVAPKRIAAFGTLAVIALVALIAVFEPVANRLNPAGKAEVTNYFESHYWFSVRPGIVAAIENPLTGIGVGMHRKLCADIPDGPNWLVGVNECHPHPHQFYVQIAAETGLIGLFAALVMITALLKFCFAARRSDAVLARIAWIPPALLFLPQPSADFFGQWNNLFLWFAVGLAMAMAQSGGKAPKL